MPIFLPPEGATGDSMSQKILRSLEFHTMDAFGLQPGMTEEPLEEVFEKILLEKPGKRW